LEVIDVAAPDGEPMPYGNAGDVGSVEIHGGGSPGDNNGNDHLDVGDATLVLRLLARLDSTRPWDVPRNDLNQNGVLDSGDVIKILRAAAAIDPQPQLAPAAVDLGPPGAATPIAGALPSMTESLFLPELAVLNPLKFGGTNGQLVTVQVRLTNIRTALSGASFTLNYPVTALRLPGAQFHHTGPLVPVNAMAVWNVAPAQNNYALQNGRVTLAVSSAIAWPNNNGVLAEFTFEVQPGATNQFAWPLTLTGVEITSDGFDTRPLFPSAGVFIGRKPLSGLLSVLRRHLSGELEFTLTGDPGAAYTIEASSDLAHWATLTNVVSSTGSLPFVDPQSSNFSKRFYRARPAE
jgi:hypothetical protein